MKKMISIISALAVCAAMLTACGGNKGGAETTPATTTEATTAATTTEAATTEPVTDAPDDNGADNGGVSDEPVSGNPLQPLVDAVTSEGEWPMLMEVTDEQMLSDFFMLDKNNANYRNMIVLQCPMSAVMTEIIIIEADDVDAAKSDLEARKKKAQDLDAFYPADAELAAASIVGSEGNYVYFLLAKEAEDAEKALVNAIKAL